MKVLKIKINKEGIDYLENVVETGKNFQLHEYYQLDKYEKDSLLGSMFSERLLKLMIKHVEDENQITVQQSKSGEIIIKKKILVNLLGEKKGSRSSLNNINSSTISINSYPTVIRISLSGFVLKGDELICYINIDEAHLTEKSIIKAVPKEKINLFKSADKIDYDIYYKDLNRLKMIKKNDLPDLFIEKFKDCFEQMDMPISNSKWLEMFFNKLNYEGLTFVYGEDVAKLSRIFENLNNYYPLYNSLSMDQKLAILTEGYQNSRTRFNSKYSIDPCSIARCVFDILLDNDLVNLVSINSVDYEILEKHTEDIVREGKLVEKDFLRWIRFKYQIDDQKSLTTGFQASYLWNLLCRSNFFFGFRS